eukprot:768351-Hanusia_phi.AAC.18
MAASPIVTPRTSRCGHAEVRGGQRGSSLRLARSRQERRSMFQLGALRRLRQDHHWTISTSSPPADSPTRPRTPSPGFCMHRETCVAFALSSVSGRQTGGTRDERRAGGRLPDPDPREGDVRLDEERLAGFLCAENIPNLVKRLVPEEEDSGHQQPLS